MKSFAEFLKDVSGAEMSETVKTYLKEWIIMRKKILWRNLSNCKPNLTDLLKIQAEAKLIDVLQQDLLLSKLKGDEARRYIEEIETKSKIYE